MALAGCGSSIDYHPSTAKQYASSVAGLCAKYASAADSQLSSVTQTTSSKTVVLGDVIKIEAPIFQKLETVTPPSGDAPAGELRTDLATFLKTEKSLEAKLKAGNRSALLSSAVTLSVQLSGIQDDFTATGASSCNAS